MNTPPVVVIRVVKYSANVCYREYFVDEKISLIPRKDFIVSSAVIDKRSLIDEVGDIGAYLLYSIRRIDGLESILLTHESVGITKKRGKDWKIIEDKIFILIQSALQACDYLVYEC